MFASSVAFTKTVVKPENLTNFFTNNSAIVYSQIRDSEFEKDGNRDVEKDAHVSFIASLNLA